MNEDADRFVDESYSHRRVDAAAGANIYVVGDVHGYRLELEALLDRLDPERTTNSSCSSAT